MTQPGASTRFPNSKVAHISSFPHEIERHIFFLASSAPRSMYQYLLVAKRVHHWLEPLLYRTVDLYCERMAESFIGALRERPVFARTTVKALSLRQSVTPEQAAIILRVCNGIQELALYIIANLPGDQNPLHAPLNTLELTTLSLDLASAFYGPSISLSDLPLLCRIERLHLANSWVARCGFYMGLYRLRNLTHISFPVRPRVPGRRSVQTEILTYILQLDPFPRLRVVILWRMPSQESSAIYSTLEHQGLSDNRIVVFNAARLVPWACAEDDDLDFWKLAEMVVLWRDSREGQGCFDVPDVGQFHFKLPL